MNHVRFIKSAMLLLAAVTLIGCKQKQETAAPGTAAPQQDAGGVKSISGQKTAGTVATSSQDKADAQAAAAGVLAKMEEGAFSSIYNEAAPGFRQIGTEAQFVAKFQQTRQKTGPLKNPQETSFISRPDNAHVLTYRLVNDRFTTERRLTFVRAKSGKMELAGLNQHDEPKK